MGRFFQNQANYDSLFSIYYRQSVKMYTSSLSFLFIKIRIRGNLRYEYQARKLTKNIAILDILINGRVFVIKSEHKSNSIDLIVGYFHLFQIKITVEETT